MDPNSARMEAERCIGISIKLLTTRDFHVAKQYAIRSRDSDPNNPLPDQILAIIDTILAAENRVNQSQHPDWYTVLQLPRLVRDTELIADHYRRLVMLLNPEINRLPFSDFALKLVVEAWSILSDPNKKWVFDNELAGFIQMSVQQPTVNVFQFFQQPVVPVVEQPLVAPHSAAVAVDVMPMWQAQQPQLQPQHHNKNGNGNNNDDMHEFMQPQLPLKQPSVAQWQKRDPTPPRVVDAVPVEVQAPTQVTPKSAISVPLSSINNDVNNADYDNDIGNSDNDNLDVDDSDSDVNEDDYEEVDEEEDEIESFWTSCPYCLYTYEYQKEYLDCTLRCRNCRRGFHAAQIPNPPPFSVGGKAKGNGYGNEINFCCWGYYPLGFSASAWRKLN